jgi:hypothetical protein
VTALAAANVRLAKAFERASIVMADATAALDALADSTVLDDEDDGDWVCGFCDRGQCGRCSNPACTCCNGNPEETPWRT